MSGPQTTDRDSARGQGMVEYLVLLFGCMLTLLTILLPMSNAVRTYLQSIYFCVSLPFP